ncbi:GAP family protein [Cryobacterium sp. 1639]|uniref:GAP family protein n=1 Tax=Cryobacterium inferilacus TaxID=2866629 RepID=UPI001C732935|nr:GAP family protein [Cryobacterium sp. 1639]MBX0301481.1 GAP family protein [Cryobacterium sp. 1639]
MGEWGQLLPLALTIALSPLPLAALLLMLLAPGGFRAAAGFSIGWFVGVLIAATLLALLSSLLPHDRGAGSGVLQGVVPLLLGAALIVLGIVRWHDRPQPGVEVPLPRWLTALDRLTPARATIIGVGYAAFRPKNLVMAAAAGVVILGAHADPTAIVFSVAVFTALASITMLGPVFAYAFGGEAVRGRLVRLREWLVRNMPTITVITVLVLGVFLVLAGLGALLAPLVL